MQSHILLNWLGKSSLILLFSILATIGIAQKPNTNYRLPVTPDMPDWAKQLYQDDVKINIFELDEEFEAWERAYEEEHEGEKAEAEDEDQHVENLWEAYYNRWRRAVEPFVQPDGSLDFTIETKDLKPKAKLPAKSSASNWSYLGPVITRQRVNQNPAQPLTPFQSNIYCLDVAPSNPDILYYGSESGVIGKTTDKGLNWTQVGADFVTGGGLIFGVGIGAVAIHPTDPDIVYASEMGSSQRIVTTTDGGTNWSSLLHIPNFNCEDLKIKPDEPEVVLAAGSSLQRRTAGNVWTNVLSKRTYDIAFKPNDPSIAYALVINGSHVEFWKSTDGGLTFSVRSWTTPAGSISSLSGRLAVTPADDDRIYAILLTGFGPRLMRSDDAGENWVVQAESNETGLIGPCTDGAFVMTNGQGFFDLAIAASPTNADHIMLGTTTSYKSTDGGVSFTRLGGYCGPFNIHPDIQEMVAKGGDSWIVTDGGINYSTDFFTDPANHSVRINNVRGTEYWGFGSGWNDDVLVGGRYHNGNAVWRESYAENAFLTAGGGEAPTGYVNPGNSSMAYFSDLPSGGRILPAAIDQPHSNFSVSMFPNEGFFPLESGEQEWDPRYMYTYYLGKDNQFWKTTDNGKTFTSLFTHAITNADVRYIEVSRTDPDVIYFTVQIPGSSSDGQLWKTTDGGATWNQCSNPGTLSASERRISKVTLSGIDANTLWWCFRTGPNGQKVFKSTDGGATWDNWTTATLDGVSAADIVHQLGTNGGVYFFSSEAGQVYYRDNVSPDWTIHNTNLPIRLGLVFAIPFYRDSKLRIATDIGIWEADLCATSTTTLVQPMTENAIVDCVRDTIQLESYSVVNGPATYQWSISPTPQWISDPNIRNPRVVLGPTPGTYAATLTITDDNGVTTRTINDFITNLPLGDLCSADSIPGNAISLNGQNNYALPNGNLNLNSNTVTFTAWVKRNGAQDNFAAIVFASGGTTSAGINIDAGNHLRYHWNGSGSAFNSGLLVPDNEWAHVALVITPSNTTLYLNGVGATNGLANPIEAFDAPLVIGSQRSFFGSRDFKGLIDEVTVWDKSLTQDEIRELMHLTQIPSNQPNLVAYYQFNEPSGDVRDRVGKLDAALVSASRVVSTGPFGGGSSSRLTVAGPGTATFSGTDVILGFPAAGTYPDGEIVVSRINIEPDSLPAVGCSDYTSDGHYWIIDNYGTNQTFTALDSMRLDNILVPLATPTLFHLNQRTANAHLLPWTLQPGSSSGAASGPTGHITFGASSSITQFGQFLATLESETIVNAPTVTQPTCSTPTGTIVVNATDPGILEYSVDNGASWQASNTFSGLNPGNYNIKVRLQANHACMTAYAQNPVVLNTATNCCALEVTCPPMPLGTIACNGAVPSAAMNEAGFEALGSPADIDNNYCGTLIITHTDVYAPPGNICNGQTMTRTYTVMDDNSSANCTQTLNIDPPTLLTIVTCPTSPAPIEWPVGFNIQPVGSNTPQDPSIAPSNYNNIVWSGNCGAVTVSYQDVLAGPSPANCPNLWTVTRTWTVTDNCMLSATCVQTFTFTDTTPPTLANCPADPAPIEWPAGFNTTAVGPNTPQDPSIAPAVYGMPTASDNCGTPTLIYQDVIAGPSPANCPNLWVVTRTWTATDACGLTAVCVQTFTFTDTTPPDITACPTTVNIEGCGTADIAANGHLSYSTVPIGVSKFDFNNELGTASDNCGIQFYMYQDVTSGTCPIVVTRTWTVTDYCGLATTCTQVFNIDDTTAPTVGCTGIPSINLTANGNLTITPSQVFDAGASSDNCGTVTPVSVLPNNFTCQNEGPNTVTLTAEDICGNLGTCTATVFIEDFITSYTAIPTAESCAGAADGKITASATAGGGQMKYSIDGVNFQAVGLFTNLSPGNYTVTFKVFGIPAVCQKTTTVTVAAGPSSATWYKDNDNDGWSDGISQVSCTRPTGYKTSAELNGNTSGDCNDNDPNAFPGQTWYKDADNDNYTNGMTQVSCLRPTGYKTETELANTTDIDCNDNSASVNHGATEVCNGIDDNCNGQIDEGLSGETYVGNITFSTQAQVNAWSACYSIINGNVSITGAGVNNLSPLSNIVQITGNLTIQSTGLASMNGLESLVNLGGTLIIFFNSSLTTVNGLGNLATVGGAFYMYYNFLLSDCCAIRDLINGGVTGTTVIFYNKVGCNSVAEINNNCVPSPIVGSPSGNGTQVLSSFAYERSLTLVPNPAKDKVTVQVTGKYDSGWFKVVDLTGRTVHAQPLADDDSSPVIQLDNWNAGIYFVQVQVDGETFTQKLIVN